MIHVTIEKPEDGETERVRIELRDDDAQLRQVATVSESADEWALIVFILTV